MHGGGLGSGRLRMFVAAGLILAMLTAAFDAAAARTSRRGPARKPRSTPVKPVKKEVQREVSTICIEAESGAVLQEENADLPRPPASMVKMMLMLLVSEGIRDGRWTLETPITVTEHAQRMGGTQVFLKSGEVFTLGHLMLAVAVASANDAAMAVAEGLWGAEETYKKAMNQRAAELGMTRSKFNSVHGLPPSQGEEPDTTTARDMARLAQELVKDPLVFKWTQVREIVFRPGEDPKENTNKLLWQLDGCDGLKTGYINMAGFCITATAMRNGIRLIAVVMGMGRNEERFALAKEILETGFANVCRHTVIAEGETVEPGVTVMNCEMPEIRLAAASDLVVVINQADKDKVKLVAEFPPYLHTPLRAGTKMGVIRAELDGKRLAEVPAVVPVDLQEARWHWKLMRSIN